jgi:hypothetical protein
VTGWGRSQRAVLSVGVGLMVVWTAACASAPAKIPSASAKPSPKATSIAPGVSVNPALLVLPPFTVSTTNPLPAGVSAKQVVGDVVTDDLIQNEALERGNPALLAYSDTGDVLTLDQNQISENRANAEHVLDIRDSVSTMELGTRADPNNAAAQVAVIVRGNETTKEETTANKPRVASQRFEVLVWLLWSTQISQVPRSGVKAGGTQG